MEQQLLLMLLALVAGSVGSVALAALLLLLRPVKLQQVSGYLSDLAGGTLLGAAFFLTSPEMGVFVTLSVIVHDPPGARRFWHPHSEWDVEKESPAIQRLIRKYSNPLGRYSLLFYAEHARVYSLCPCLLGRQFYVHCPGRIDSCYAQ